MDSFQDPLPVSFGSGLPERSSRKEAGWINKCSVQWGTLSTWNCSGWGEGGQRISYRLKTLNILILNTKRSSTAEDVRRWWGRGLITPKKKKKTDLSTLDQYPCWKTSSQSDIWLYRSKDSISPSQSNQNTNTTASNFNIHAQIHGFINTQATPLEAEPLISALLHRKANRSLYIWRWRR